MYESVRLKQNSYFPDKNIYVKYQEWDVPYASMIHAHDFYELEFVIEGNGFELVNGKHFEKKRGTVTISTPADYHFFEISEKTALIDIMFTEQVIPSGFANQIFSKSYPRTVRLSEEKTQDLISVCELLDCVEGYKDAIRQRLEKKLLESALLIILSQFEEHGEVKSYEKTNDIDVVLQYIDLHFEENPSLEEVAEVIGKSPAYFSRFFKRSTGLYYSDYLNVRKVECAEMLLRFSNMSITDICFSSGFNSLSNFLRVFKDSKGIPPGDYRKKHRQQ
jgi:AraC-like DNA-binding protein